MRLTPEQAAIIRSAAAEVFGSDARVWLFGSRVDDAKRGGDIDLLIEAAQLPAVETFMRKVRFLGKLEESLGERKIDVVIQHPGDTRASVRIAHETGIEP
ncbi:nucleotidyltransferase family protein [Metallibacterium scheffleri]|uniref:DNA polymerase beta n=1 Tax=Metallibacterium scheffleri TaxID=993689 RepID=A0A4S3KLD8_9GAMM|nr:nucleotidyltransferase domain-containing protein [Metallibacterium scheffleri]THD09530.1 DNA polymerase beta [Metallibacterium scheffleri]